MTQITSQASTLTNSSNPLDSDQILIHMSGPDRPGVTSTLSQIVSQEKAQIIDLGQSVLHGYLTLSAIITLPHGSDVLKKLLFAASGLGLKLEVSSWGAKKYPAIDLPSPETQFAESLCITLLGNLGDGNALSKTTQFLADRSMNIRDIKTLSPGQLLNGIEFSVDLFTKQPVSREELKDLRGQILKLASEIKCDLAVQQDDIFRRHKRMLCMDVDSTFIQIEVIDEMARIAGVYDKVAEITERAMQGKLDFKEALRERVSLLKGLKMSDAKKILDNIPLTPGAEKLLSAVKSLGFKVGLVSGGFDFIVDELKKRFNLDFAFSNKLEVDSLGLFTGRLTGSIVDGERKAQVLHDMTQVLSFHPSQTIAVGDGANDRLMLESAGLGIAFKAKPKLQEVADLSINQGSLDSLLLLMGISSKDLGRLKSPQYGKQV